MNKVTVQILLSVRIFITKATVQVLLSVSILINKVTVQVSFSVTESTKKQRFNFVISHFDCYFFFKYTER